MEKESMFSNRLKSLRKDLNLTQSMLADKLGIVRTAVTNYETGRALPDPNTLEMIAEIFNVSTDYLLGRTDTRITNPLFDNSISYRYSDKPVSYEDILNYVDKHLASLPEDQRDYLVKQVNEKYWNSKNINQKNYSSRNKKNNHEKN